MKKVLLAAAACCITMLIWCQENKTEIQTDSIKVKLVQLPVITKFGTPDGNLASKDIGPSGGTIASEDGKVELIFPEGALKSTATISIQPTTNLVQNGNGKAYQLEPSGTQFLKPVSVIIHYTEQEAAICPPELMFLAIQDSTGKWEYMDYNDWDSTTKSLKGFITHFSSVVNGNLAELYPREHTLKVNSSMEFFLNIVQTSNQTPVPAVDDGEDILPPLPAIAPLGNFRASWQVNGIDGGTPKFGTIAPKQNKSTATYTAPILLPLNYVVTVKLKASLFKEKTTGKKRKMIEFNSLAKQVSFTSTVNLYDLYDVKIDALADNTHLGAFTQKWTDESSFRLRVGKDPEISNIINNVYKLEKENFTNNKCVFIYRNSGTCKGPIHVAGITGAGLAGGSASTSVTAMVDFVKVPWELPDLQITCQGRSVPNLVLPALPALPHKMKFELKTGTFKEDYSGAADFLPGGKVTMTLKQVTED